MKIIVLDQVEKFLSNLNDDLLANVRINLLALEENPFKLEMPLNKKIGKNLFELRTTGSIQVRVLYMFKWGCIIVVHGFVKKTRKIPKKELDLAKKRSKSLT